MCYLFLGAFNLMNAAAEHEKVTSHLRQVLCGDTASIVSGYYGNECGNSQYEKCLDLKGHAGAITSVALSADNTRLVSASTDNTVRLWSDLKSKPCSREIYKDARNMYAVALKKDGSLLAAGGKAGLLYLFDNRGNKVGESGKELLRAESTLLSIVFNPQGNTVAVGTTNGVVNFLDLETSTPLEPIVHSATYVNSIDYDSSGNLLLSGCADSTVRVWDRRAKGPVQKLDKHKAAVNTVCFNDPRGEIVSGSHDELAIVWDKRTWLPRLDIKNVTMFNKSVPVHKVAVSEDGEQVALTQRTSIALYSIQEGQHKQWLSEHTGCINAVCYSSDGNYLVSGSGDKTMCLYSKQ